MESLKHVIAKNLIALRKKSHLTQAELAEKVSYSDKSVSKWETGETTPSIEILKTLAVFYNVTVDDIINKDFNVESTFSIKEQKISHLAIILLSIFSVLLLAIALFAFFLMSNNHVLIKMSWLFFIYFIPCSAILALIGCAVWGNKHKYTWIIIISSLLMWSVILSIYLSLLIIGNINMWTLWIIGIPIEIILILSFKIRKK
jgi:transcriptional regulator with XRE-family HTH domain